MGADIASQMEDTWALLNTVLSLQPKKVSGGDGEKSSEDIVLELIAQIKDQIPQPWDAKLLRKKFELDQSPLTVVLLQEIDRYNKLLAKIHATLHELNRGIQGLVVISADLEKMFEALVDAKVPALWSFAYNSIKSLGPWTRDLIA